MYVNKRNYAFKQTNIVNNHDMFTIQSSAYMNEVPTEKLSLYKLLAVDSKRKII